MDKKRIAVLVGSLRKESYNRRIANELIRLVPDSLELQILEIGDLPLYNEDLEEHAPLPWVKFRDKLKGYDGVLFVTPEYNRSIPGVLKNAIDVGSRPSGKSVWKGKPGAVISVTTGRLGAFGANHILRQSMVFLDVSIMQQPEAYISNVGELFDANSRVSGKTEILLKDFMESYVKWI
ncbi:NADPH-dependent FMN reductase [Flammeovirgaceae bacterium]